MLAGRPQNVQANVSYPTEQIPCSSDAVKYIWKYRMPQIKDIQKKLRAFNGDVGLDDAIFVTARSDGIEWAKQMVNELIGKIVCDNFEIVQPGITTFCTKRRMDSLLRIVENEEKCYIRVEKGIRQPTTQPSAGPSPKGSAVVGTCSPSTDINTAGSPGVGTSVKLSADSSVVFVTPQGHKISWKIGDITTEQV